MNAKEFKRVFAVAQNTQNMSKEEEYQACVALGGIGIEPQRRLATIRQVAWFIRWQCLQFDANWDMEELSNTKFYFKKVDLLD